MTWKTFLPILEEMRGLLLRHGRTGRADYLEKLMTMAAEESPEFRKEITSGDMWSGAGSVADVFFTEQAAQRRGARESDNARFRRLLIRTSDEMVAHGIRYPDGEAIADALRHSLHLV